MTTSESKGRFFFYKTNRFESRIGMLYYTPRSVPWATLVLRLCRQLASKSAGLSNVVKLKGGRQAPSDLTPLVRYACR